MFMFNLSTGWSAMPETFQCLEATRKIESEYNIPPHILSAIALTESGRRDHKTKLQMPWPWTANIGGAGRYFKTKNEALLTFKQLIAKKNYMFDVGCMQINWRYHKNAFSSIEQALDPYYNVRYAAEFLTSLYAQTGSWTQAAVYYHSKTPVYYQKYRKIVGTNWDKARDLMSPIDGHLHKFFTQASSGTLLMSKKTTPISHTRMKRMQEIARLRTRIRQYAQNQ
jgi:hypothetical protein